MANTGLGSKRWGDVDDDDDEEETAGTAKHWETQPDENGIFSRFSYETRDAGTFKIIHRMRRTVTTTWTNKKIQERKSMQPFGKVASNDPATEKALCIRSEEEVPVELSRQIAQQAIVKDEAEEKFYEESLTVAENLNVKKQAWTDLNKARQEERDQAGVDRPEEPDKPADLRDAAAQRTGEAPRPTGYVPPSLRNAAEKGKGKGGEEQASLRITNLAEDCKEGDLQNLFGSVGRVSRVYIARDQETRESRGFAFVTYYTRADAEKAIKKLDGHPYDNLILKVQFAKPRV